MQQRTWSSRVRGVRFYVAALAVVAASFVNSLVYSQSAKAEGFLDTTLGCLLTLYIPAQCRPAVAPAAPTPAPVAEVPQDNSTSAGSPVASPPATAAPPAPSADTEYSIPPAFLREEPPKEVERPPELPAAVHNRSFSYEPMAYLAYTYGVVKGASTEAATPGGEVLESTANGWRFLGVTWYWWLVVMVVISTLVIWLKQNRYKKNLSIAKQ